MLTQLLFLILSVITSLCDPSEDTSTHVICYDAERTVCNIFQDSADFNDYLS